MAVKSVVDSSDEFAEETRAALKLLLADDKVGELRMELATITSIGKPLAILCYDNERDGKLQCAKAFDRWNSTYDHLRESIKESTTKERRAILLPEVHENAVALSDGNAVEYRRLMSKAIEAISVLEEYMRTYGSQNLERTMRVLRACRFFNFFFIAETNIEALEEEIEHLLNISYFSEPTIMEKLKEELPRYKAEAQAAVAKHSLSDDDMDKDLWTFWKRSQLKLKNFWLAAAEIAIIQPSSAFVERLFSFLRGGFDDTQDLALEDYKEASVMMRCNEVQREKEEDCLTVKKSKKARK